MKPKIRGSKVFACPVKDVTFPTQRYRFGTRPAPSETQINYGEKEFLWYYIMFIWFKWIKVSFYTVRVDYTNLYVCFLSKLSPWIWRASFNKNPTNRIKTSLMIFLKI